jgi:hypothetical protein
VTQQEIEGLVTETMATLARRRRIFHREADLQHEFAWQLHLDHPEALLRLELRPFADEGFFLDLLARLGEQRIAIELKYLAARLDCLVEGERFFLREQSADDTRRYDVLHDVERLERLVYDGWADAGAAIVLTNASTYWRAAETDTNYAAFRIHDGATVTGSLAWGPRTGAGTMRGRERVIELRGSYELSWRDYSRIELDPGARGGREAFRYTVIAVGR